MTRFAKLMFPKSVSHVPKRELHSLHSSFEKRLLLPENAETVWALLLDRFLERSVLQIRQALGYDPRTWF
jgi:hypothetical protein